MRKRSRSSSTTLKKPIHPTNYPHGSCIETEKGFFYIRGKGRLHLPTYRIVQSWSFARIIPTTEAAVNHYPVIARMGFRDGTLIYNIADGRIFLVANNERRHVKNPDALERIGARITDAVLVSEYEVNLQREGADLV